MKLFKINRIIVYILIGALIIIFNDFILDKHLLSWIVGISTLVLSVEGLIYDIYFKKYETDRNHIGTEIFKIAVSILILTVFRNDLDMICICWAILVGLTATRALNKSIYGMVAHKPFMISMLFSILELTLAILLVTNPSHHVSTHVVLLGIELIVEGIASILHALYKMHDKGEEDMNELE